ncbi:MAG TPA: hypothetical protein VG253_04910 [Streptosporangiaceae bacterium]|nr:hypothetical protein [Streptosporangiaceae bacterium]
MAVPGVDGGRLVIWTAYQNGINPDGTPGTPGGPTKTTMAGYDAKTGALVKTIAVTGKVDGLTADPALGRLIATVNEDSNSAFNLVNPAAGAVSTYQYSPSPAVSGNGGTDSIAVRHERLHALAVPPLWWSACDHQPGCRPDDLRFATALCATAGTIMALNTRGWRAGTVFAGEPSDNANPLVGTLKLFTGHLTPLGNTFLSPVHPVGQRRFDSALTRQTTCQGVPSGPA